MRASIRFYEVPDHLKATFRLVTTLVALAFAWGLAYAALGVHVGLGVLPGLVAVGLLVGVFIVAHDCAHVSFHAPADGTSASAGCAPLCPVAEVSVILSYSCPKP